MNRNETKRVASRMESKWFETTRNEAKRVELSWKESKRVEASRNEAKRIETNRSESKWVETSRNESKRIETSRNEATWHLCQYQGESIKTTTLWAKRGGGCLVSKRNCWTILFRVQCSERPLGSSIGYITSATQANILESCRITQSPKRYTNCVRGGVHFSCQY